MTLLLHEIWPWLLIGIGLCTWGVKTVDIPLDQWMRLLTSLFYSPFTDDTKTEKIQLKRPTEELASANPGCAMVACGLLFVAFGIFRWLT